MDKNDAVTTVVYSNIGTSMTLRCLSDREIPISPKCPYLEYFALSSGSLEGTSQSNFVSGLHPKPPEGSLFPSNPNGDLIGYLNPQK